MNYIDMAIAISVESMPGEAADQTLVSSEPVMIQPQAWFARTAVRSPRLRLFCFPSAGRGASGYVNWRPLFPEPIEVLPTRLPGREGRLREQPITRFPELLERLAEHIEPLLDVPFAFFGHSLGALVGFELARRLRARGRPLPMLLMVAARSAPHLRTTTPIYHLPQDQFLRAIQDRYGQFHEDILKCQDIVDRSVPALRADFTLFDTYVYTEAAPLECPIRAYGGSQDTMISSPDLEAWNVHTAGRFTYRRFDGPHFFFEKDEHILAQLIGDITQNLMNLSAV
jgi:surfactin synthase thioesterase subunit